MDIGYSGVFSWMAIPILINKPKDCHTIMLILLSFLLVHSIVKMGVICNHLKKAFHALLQLLYHWCNKL